MPISDEVNLKEYVFGKKKKLEIIREKSINIRPPKPNLLRSNSSKKEKENSNIRQNSRKKS
jgi:hypothetical protein